MAGKRVISSICRGVSNSPIRRHATAFHSVAKAARNVFETVSSRDCAPFHSCGSPLCAPTLRRHNGVERRQGLADEGAVQEHEEVLPHRCRTPCSATSLSHYAISSPVRGVDMSSRPAEEQDLENAHQQSRDAGHRLCAIWLQMHIREYRYHLKKGTRLVRTQP